MAAEAIPFAIFFFTHADSMSLLVAVAMISVAANSAIRQIDLRPS